MKRYKTISILFFFSVFVSNLALAEIISPSEQNASYSDQYGIIDAVYLKNSRMVISDMDLHYTFGSGFYKDSGARISDIGKELKPGTPVIYHYYKNKGLWVLKDLKVISEREYQNSQKRDRD